MTALAMIIAVMLTPASAQVKFNDIQGYWAQPCIEKLAQKQMISGYPDGSFKPNSPVTRSEFAAMLRKAFPNATEVRNPIQFADVSANYWGNEAIRKAYQTGFLSGYPGQVFNPNLEMPRVQVLVSLASGLKYGTSGSVENTLNAAFTDNNTIPDYARSAIAAATEKQLVVNYPNPKTLNPNQLASRADVATFLCQATGMTGLVPAQYITKVGTATQSSEIRGVWLTNIDSDVLFDRDRLSSAIQRLRELNFNSLYPTVWNGGYTLYPSLVAAKVIGRSLDPTTGLQGRDILQEIIVQGHQKGMGVIPWMEFGFMAPADSELAQLHPTWLTQKSGGSTIWPEGDNQRVWLNPLHPEVQKFILDLVDEIVANYDIDGIQFDDHFGFPAEFGYDPFTIELYQQEHAGQSPPNNYKDPSWIRWRADKVTDFMKRVFQTVKNRQPKAIVSLSPNPQEFSYNSALADWETWERQGLIEELIIQIYRHDISRFIAELERPEVKTARQHIPVAIGVLTGIKPRAVSIAQIQAQVKAVRDRNFAGVSFFFYESLWNLAKESPAERQSAIQEIFPSAIERSNIFQGWKPQN